MVSVSVGRTAPLITPVRVSVCVPTLESPCLDKTLSSLSVHVLASLLASLLSCSVSPRLQVVARLCVSVGRRDALVYHQDGPPKHPAL